MHLKRIHIEKYRVLEDLTINFQVPHTPSKENNGNVVNVIAGVNGTGKTSLFDAIVQEMGMTFIHPHSIKIHIFDEKQAKYIDYDKEKMNSADKLIYIPARTSHSYKKTERLDNKSNTDLPIIINDENVLGDAECYIREFIVSQERSSHEADPKKRTQAAVNAFNQHFVKTDLLTHLHDLDPQQFNRPIFKNSHSDIITIAQLSDGEKQLYGRVVSLMILNPKNSVILIDEPEIALHPAWQQMIMRIYARIGENNQFIVATHSPHIIADTAAENLIFLRKNPDTQKIEAIHQKSPPAGVDVNSILYEFMGVQPIPKEQLELHKQYRKCVEDGEENLPPAQEIKQQILRKESLYSEFMQEMAFLQQLRES